MSTFKNLPIPTFILWLYMSVMPLLGSGLLLGQILYQPEFWQANYLAWILISIPLMAFALAPTTALALASGFLFGPSQSFMLIPAYLVAALIAFGLARMVDRGGLLAFINQYPRVNTLTQKVQNESIWLVILCRISPILPFAMMNVVLAAIGLPKRVYMTGSLLGMLPRTILFILAGWQAKSLSQALQSGSDTPWMAISTLILILISILGLGLYFRKISQNESRSH